MKTGFFDSDGLMIDTTKVYQVVTLDNTDMRKVYFREDKNSFWLQHIRNNVKDRDNGWQLTQTRASRLKVNSNPTYID